MNRDCPTGCGRTAPSGKLMCRQCWGEVPRHLQNAVYRTWGAWSKDMTDVGAMQAYREASESAIAAVA